MDKTTKDYLESREQFHFGMTARMEFETDGAHPLEVLIFVDRTTAVSDLWIASYQCGSITMESVLWDPKSDGFGVSDVWMAQQMLNVIKECDEEYSCNYMYRAFLNYGVRIRKEIKNARTIQYGANKEWRWPDFPKRLKAVFE